MDDRPIYMISVAAELVGMHPQTLRIYEQKGLVRPKRTPGNTRLYSERDLERLRLIQRLTNDLGLNLAGVETVLRMQDEIDRLRRQVARLERQLRDEVARVGDALGRRIKILVGKPGLDGHSNGAEQIAVRARDAGMDVVYEGIRLTPARIARSAVDEGVHVVGLSILSGSHAELIPAVLGELAEAGAEVPVVVGGIIPPADEAALREAGVAAVYTPKDFEVSRIMGDIVDLVAEHHGVAAVS